MLERVVVSLSEMPYIYVFAFGKLYKLAPISSQCFGSFTPYAASTLSYFDVVFNNEGEVIYKRSLADLKAVNNILSQSAINDINNHVIDLTTLNRSSIKTFFHNISSTINHDKRYRERVKTFQD